jgi:hypothetical protein
MAAGAAVLDLPELARANSCHPAWKCSPPPPSDTTAPSVPAGLQATAGDQQVALSWTASTDPDSAVLGYHVYRDGTHIADVTGTSYANGGLTDGTTYSYTVSAYDPAGNVSAQSSPVTATPQSPPTASSSAPPPAAGYFSLQPVGSWSSLPSGSQCAAQVHMSTWEPRPENSQQDNTMPAPGAMAASFSTRPRDQGGTYDSRWDTWLLPRVDGQFTGTTDEILQWAGCKWGLPDNLIRADAVVESTWFQYLHFPNDASLGGGGGSCYWDRGCGDAFSSPTTASTTYCQAVATEGLTSTTVHDYQLDPITSSGGYPYTPQTGMCPKTFSILGIMSWENPAWEAPYPAYPGNQNGTFPFTRDSTAAAADYWGAYMRGCYEGWESWLKNTGTGTYAAGDIWGCIGSWYDGVWHDSGADTYISYVQTEENNQTWLTSSFDASQQQYSCDPKYQCPT